MTYKCSMVGCGATLPLLGETIVDHRAFAEKDDRIASLTKEVERLRTALKSIGDECSPFHSDGRTHAAQAKHAWETARGALQAIADARREMQG